MKAMKANLLTPAKDRRKGAHSSGRRSSGRRKITDHFRPSSESRAKTVTKASKVTFSHTPGKPVSRKAGKENMPELVPYSGNKHSKTPSRKSGGLKTPGGGKTPYRRAGGKTPAINKSLNVLTDPKVHKNFPESLTKQYKIIAKIDAGTFSEVYKAKKRKRNGELGDELVAIKRVNCISSTRMMSEIKVLTELGTRGACAVALQIYRFGCQMAIVLPYIDHIPFTKYFWTMNEEDIRHYLAAFLSSLAFLARYGWVHRDVKPTNFLHRPKNWGGRKSKAKYMLVDFGMAQRTDELLGKAKAQEAELLRVYKRNKKVQCLRKTWGSANKFLRMSARKRTKTPGTARRKRRRLNMRQMVDLEKEEAEAAQKLEEQCKGRLSKNPYPNKAILKKVKNNRVEVFPYLNFINKGKSNEMVMEELIDETLPGAERAGTRGYRAPEVLFRTYHQTPAVDIWSLGMILFSIMTRIYPVFVPSSDELALLELIHVCGYRPIQVAANHVGRYVKCVGAGVQFNGFKDFAKKVLLDPHKNCKPLSKDMKIDYNKRPTNYGRGRRRRYTLGMGQFGDCCAQSGLEWSDELWDLLEKMLDVNQFHRATAEECLRHPFFTKEYARRWPGRNPNAPASQQPPRQTEEPSPNRPHLKRTNSKGHNVKIRSELDKPQPAAKGNKRSSSQPASKPSKKPASAAAPSNLPRPPVTNRKRKRRRKVPAPFSSEQRLIKK